MILCPLAGSISGHCPSTSGAFSSYCPLVSMDLVIVHCSRHAVVNISMQINRKKTKSWQVRIRKVIRSFSFRILAGAMIKAYGGGLMLSDCPFVRRPTKKRARDEGFNLPPMFTVQQ
jgi:hypothetical protein